MSRDEDPRLVPGLGAEERQRVTLVLLAQRGRVDVGELASRFEVAEETIRRDLRVLEGEGRLRRAHGGAILPASLAENLPSIGPEAPQHPLARDAAHLLPDGGTVFLDAGALCEALAGLVPNSRELTIVTNSISVALIASRNDDLVVYNVGGGVSADGEQSGQWAREMLADVRFDVAFLSAHGVDGERVLASTPHSAAVKSAVVAAAARNILLLDTDQTSPSGFISYAKASQFDVVIGRECPADGAVVPASEAEAAV